MTNRRIQARRLLVPLAVVAFLVAGCGAAMDTGSTSSAPAADMSGGGAAERAAMPAAAPTMQAEGESGNTAGQDSVNPKPLQIETTERAIIYTAEMTVRATDVTKAADSAKRIVLGAGGYVAEEKSTAFSGENNAVITFKVPPARYPDVINQFGTELGKRENLHQGAQDVTGEVADVAARVKSAESALDQFRLLLSKAEKIGEILEIEREIQNRTAELESLQARQKALTEQTGMATVTLSLVAPDVVLPEPENEPGGFLKGLSTGWKALVDTVKVGLTALGVLLPWLIPGAVLWFAIRWLIRQSRRNRPTPQPIAVTPPRDPVPPKDPVKTDSTQ